ncbi:MAG: sigma-54-dependent Fis family transcriptional regulator [Acidobacteria bacterium]|nr:sigma-54-dependent Fis family transcriptional regulator [Acidobacteriota bacterium]
MKSQKVLLFGLDTAGGVISDLQTTLEPHFNLFVQSQDERMEDSSAGFLSARLEECIHETDPSLVFLILAPHQLRETTASLASARNFNVPIIVVVEACDADQLFALVSAGVADFIVPPLSAANILPRAWRLLKDNQPLKEVRDQPGKELGVKRLVGRSPAFVTQVENIPAIAKCEANVLIVGETGTGKELYARGIHYCSPRAGKPFMPVNCGAIPVDLVENELFGHERGAFTSASNLQAGLIAEANGGTLFLDEIDCLPIMAQVKLLRFLQEKEYRPLGSARMRQANVRIVAASNLDLQEAVGNGRVRQDLFYRLNVISLVLPPLRERREDIPLLARHFLDKYSTEFNKQTIDLAPDALNSLMVHSWPGNVRELEHVIERAIVLCQGPVIRSGDLAISTSQFTGVRESLQQAKAKEIARFEKNYIQGLLSACKGNITKAAEVAQKNRRAFWQLIQKHEINVGTFKSTRS